MKKSPKAYIISIQFFNSGPNLWRSYHDIFLLMDTGRASAYDFVYKLERSASSTKLIRFYLKISSLMPSGGRYGEDALLSLSGAFCLMCCGKYDVVMTESEDSSIIRLSPLPSSSEESAKFKSSRGYIAPIDG